MQKKGGFTLIELIIVLAVIAIILAVAAPSLLRYRDNASEIERSRIQEIVNKGLKQYYAFEGEYPNIKGYTDCEDYNYKSPPLMSENELKNGTDGLLDILKKKAGVISVNVDFSKYNFLYDNIDGILTITDK